MKIKQAIALGLAGCLLFSSTALASPPQVEKLESINVEVTEVINDNQTDIITAKKIQDKNDLVEIDISFPVISGLTDPDFQVYLNDFVKKHVIKAKDDIEAQAQEYAQAAQENNWEIRPYQLFVNYDLKANNEDVLSFTITYYTYTGGANGMTVVHCYNIDKKANKPLHLGDLFHEGVDYKTKINNEIMKQIEIRSQDENEMFFEGDMGFQTISDSQGFYLKDNDLVIVFSKYEIAPGAMGIPEFSISLDSLKNILKDKDDSKIIINGVEIETVVSEDNVVMIPLRLVVENLGYMVNWHDADQSILLTKDQATAKLKIGDDVYIANHKIPYILEAAPVIINDSTYVPVSFLETVLLYKL